MSPRSWELKSQYGHLRTHLGTWMYSESGGRESVLMLHCSAEEGSAISHLWCWRELLLSLARAFRLERSFAVMSWIRNLFEGLCDKAVSEWKRNLILREVS